MFTEEINKIALCSNINKRVPTFDRITSYPYSANAGKVCKTELPNEHANIRLLILIMLQMKTKQNIIQISHKFRIIYAKY